MKNKKKIFSPLTLCIKRLDRRGVGSNALDEAGKDRDIWFTDYKKGRR